MTRLRPAKPDPTGYPDFTLPVSIIAQIIETLKVDIVAQTLATLKIDIAAQTLDQLDVNIAAQAVTLDVNIAASAITLNISITGQTVSVKLVPDWGAIQAEDVDVAASAAIANETWTKVLSYTVPTGKTLLLYDWSALMEANTEVLTGVLMNATTGLYVSIAGGVGGFQTPFSKPKRFTAGQEAQVWLRQETGGTQTVRAHFGGTLI